jgi:hypothetical protein
MLTERWSSLRQGRRTSFPVPLHRRRVSGSAAHAPSLRHRKGIAGSSKQYESDSNSQGRSVSMRILARDCSSARDGRRCIVYPNVIATSARYVVRDIAIAQAGSKFSTAQLALLRLARTRAVAASLEAVDRMYTRTAAVSVYTRNPLGRCFRDIHTVTRHASMNQANYEVSGRMVLGSPPDRPLTGSARQGIWGISGRPSMAGHSPARETPRARPVDASVSVRGRPLLTDECLPSDHLA